MSDNNQLTVLVADDDMISLEVFKAMLSQHQVEVITAESGEQALAALQRKPDLIFLDFEMPDMSGADVCRQLRQQPAFATTPVIAVTSPAGEASSANIPMLVAIEPVASWTGALHPPGETGSESLSSPSPSAEAGAAG